MMPQLESPINIRDIPLKAVTLHVYNGKVLIIGPNGMRKIILNLNSYLELKVCCIIPLYNEIQGSDWFV